MSISIFFSSESLLSVACLGSALSAGVLASGHCVTMCGGIALGIEQTNQHKAWWHALTPHALRISVYALLGASLYLVYHGYLTQIPLSENLELPAMPRWLPAIALFISALVLSGFFAMLSKAITLVPGLPPKIGACCARNQKRNLSDSMKTAAKLQNNRTKDNSVNRIPVHNLMDEAQDTLDGSPQKGSLNLIHWLKWGWGFLPCPMVIAMLLLSVKAPNAALAAAFMAAFGLGSLPSLLGITVVSRHLKTLARYWTSKKHCSQERATRAATCHMPSRTRWLVPTLLCIGGAWTLSHELLMGGDHAHHNHAAQHANHAGHFHHQDTKDSVIKQGNLTTKTFESHGKTTTHTHH